MLVATKAEKADEEASPPPPPPLPPWGALMRVPSTAGNADDVGNDDDDVGIGDDGSETSASPGV